MTQLVSGYSLFMQKFSLLVVHLKHLTTETSLVITWLDIPITWIVLQSEVLISYNCNLQIWWDFVRKLSIIFKCPWRIIAAFCTSKVQRNKWKTKSFHEWADGLIIPSMCNKVSPSVRDMQQVSRFLTFILYHSSQYIK